jgi:hypothetical protein
MPHPLSVGSATQKRPIAPCVKRGNKQQATTSDHKFPVLPATNNKHTRANSTHKNSANATSEQFTSKKVRAGQRKLRKTQIPQKGTAARLTADEIAESAENKTSSSSKIMKQDDSASTNRTTKILCADETKSFETETAAASTSKIMEQDDTDGANKTTRILHNDAMGRNHAVKRRSNEIASSSKINQQDDSIIPQLGISDASSQEKQAAAQWHPNEDPTWHPNEDPTPPTPLTDHCIHNYLSSGIPSFKRRRGYAEPSPELLAKLTHRFLRKVIHPTGDG